MLSRLSAKALSRDPFSLYFAKCIFLQKELQKEDFMLFTCCKENLGLLEAFETNLGLLFSKVRKLPETPPHTKQLQMY